MEEYEVKIGDKVLVEGKVEEIREDKDGLMYYLKMSKDHYSKVSKEKIRGILKNDNTTSREIKQEPKPE